MTEQSRTQTDLAKPEKAPASKTRTPARATESTINRIRARALAQRRLFCGAVGQSDHAKRILFGFTAA